MRLVLALLAVLACGCASTAPQRGHLVIAGGAVKPDNEALYRAFVAPLAPDAVIGVVPTASASSAESAESSARTLSRYAAGRRIIKLDLPAGRPERAHDREVVAGLRECSGLWFTGGVQSRIVGVFRPDAGDSPAFHAACDMLARGGAIGGTSAGAAMMSDPMITGGASEQALSGDFRTEDEDSGLGIGKGMGFFPYGLTDQHFLRRGRIGRLVVALERTGISRGYGVEENSALVVDLATGTMTVIGSVVVVDISSMKREGPNLRGVRVSLLHDGDTVKGETGAIEARGGPLDLSSRSGPTEPTPDAWSAGAIEVALATLAARPDSPVELSSPGFVVRLSTDAGTTVRAQEGRITTVRAVLDVSPRAQR